MSSLRPWSAGPAAAAARRPTRPVRRGPAGPHRTATSSSAPPPPPASSGKGCRTSPSPAQHPPLLQGPLQPAPQGCLVGTGLHRRPGGEVTVPQPANGGAGADNRSPTNRNDGKLSDDARESGREADMGQTSKGDRDVRRTAPGSKPGKSLRGGGCKQ